MAIRVAVDAMGGDRAPAVVVEGAVQAVQEAAGEIEVLLFGSASRLHGELEPHDVDGLPLRVVEAPQVIGMEEAPAAAVKGKPHSSIHLGLAALKEGQAEAFISAGNTGAVMAASLFILGRLPGVSRPAVIGFYPTTESFCIVLDVGTNVDVRPEQLLQFAQMGSVYAEQIMGRAQPVVALMNIGEEPGKGNEQVKAAYELIKQQPGLNFRGNIEGRDLMHHAADVVVCDGFVGNVMLKLGESMATAMPEMVQQEMKRQALTPDEQALVAQVLQGVQRPFNYEEFGGAPLLGVSGTVLIGHGGSSARAIKKLILAAAKVARQDVAGSIAAAMC